MNSGFSFESEFCEFDFLFFFGAMVQLWTEFYYLWKWTTKQLYRLRSKVEYVLVIVIIVFVHSSSRRFSEKEYLVSISLFRINKWKIDNSTDLVWANNCNGTSFMIQFGAEIYMYANAIREKKNSKNRTEIQSYYYMQTIPFQLIQLFSYKWITNSKCLYGRLCIDNLSLEFRIQNKSNRCVFLLLYFLYLWRIAIDRSVFEPTTKLLVIVYGFGDKFVCQTWKTLWNQIVYWNKVLRF